MKWKKGVNKISIVIFPEIQGESEVAIKKYMKDKRLPKFSTIGFKREIHLGKYGYDSTEVYIIK